MATYYRNKTNRKSYRFIGRAIDATNGREGNDAVVYERDGMTFVRDAGEFFEKFEPIIQGEKQ